MKATVVREKICDSGLDFVHGMFRYIKRLVIETTIKSTSIRPGTLPLFRYDDVYIAVTPDGSQLYVSNYCDFAERKNQANDLQILAEIEIADGLAKEIVEFFLAKEMFEKRKDEFEKLLAGVGEKKEEGS